MHVTISRIPLECENCGRYGIIGKTLHIQRHSELGSMTFCNDYQSCEKRVAYLDSLISTEE